MQCFHLANAFETVFETRFEISFRGRVKKTSTRRRSRIPCVVVEKITTRRREGVCRRKK